MVNCGRRSRILIVVYVWYTMGYLFQNTMVFYHGLSVSKHHGIYHGIRRYIFIRVIPVVYLGSYNGEAKGVGMLSQPLVHYATTYRRNRSHTVKIKTLMGTWPNPPNIS